MVSNKKCIVCSKKTVSTIKGKDGLYCYDCYTTKKEAPKKINLKDAFDAKGNFKH